MKEERNIEKGKEKEENVEDDYGKGRRDRSKKTGGKRYKERSKKGKKEHERRVERRGSGVWEKVRGRGEQRKCGVTRSEREGGRGEKESVERKV